MLMTLKNKMIMGMDRLIEETRMKGGIPNTINLEPQEAADFLREIRELEDKTEIRFQGKSAGIDLRFILKQELTKERLVELITQWHHGDFDIYYKDIKLKVVKNAKPPKKP